MKWTLLLMIFMIVILFTILFYFQNRDEVTLRLGLYPLKNYQWVEVPKIPVFFVILGSVLLGAFIGWMGDFWSRFQLKRAFRQNQKRIERLEREMQSFRDAELENVSLVKKED
jgi:uncharacterized integral membrane protein